MKYRIKSSLGYIIGFSKQHQTVQSGDVAKLFTEKALDNFIANYSDAGYGFEIDDCQIEEVK